MRETSSPDLVDVPDIVAVCGAVIVLGTALATGLLRAPRRAAGAL